VVGAEGVTMIVHHLDHTGSAPLEKGYTLVESEVDFLRLATGNTPLQIRGGALCEWAERFFAGRNITLHSVKAPVDELQDALGSIEHSQAVALVELLGERIATLKRPLTVLNVLQSLYPDRAWLEPPSSRHAAWWLCWLIETQLQSAVQTLLKSAAAGWRAEADTVGLELVYGAVDAGAAYVLVKQWLGMSPPGALANLGEFPATIPAQVLRSLQGEWKQAIVATHGAVVKDLAALPLAAELQSLFADVATAYFERHPQDLSRDKYTVLEEHLSTQQKQRLQRFVPPPVPTSMPAVPAEVLTWYVREYLPYRTWQHEYGDARAAEIVADAAQSFTLWYLERYPQALLGGELQPHLSFYRTRVLRQGNVPYTTLLIVLDGLLWHDAQIVIEELRQHTARLALLESATAFSPLPTVTDFCKDALFKGLKPSLALDAPAIGTIVPESRSPIDLLQGAQPGEIYLWRVMDPDTTYHRRNSYPSLKNDIEARLKAIAKNIAELVDAVDAALPLRIVITSDHGRLLGMAERTLVVPPAMKPHGRAAWGSAMRQFPAAGYILEEDVAYLNGERFGLRDDAAISLTEDAFETNDGKGGRERYPHGGLYPEEVIVPWLALARDYVAPDVIARCSGSATAQTSAALIVEIDNLSEVALTATRLILATEAGTFAEHSLDVLCPPTYQTAFAVTLASWPMPREAAALTAYVLLRSPDRRITEVRAEVAIKSEEMYSSENILEGLDL
jgi:hypothetical protein